MASYYPTCQWCGKVGAPTSTSTGKPPISQPNVMGKCPSHPSGKPDAVHGPRWEQR